VFCVHAIKLLDTIHLQMMNIVLTLWRPLLPYG